MEPPPRLLLLGPPPAALMPWLRMAEVVVATDPEDAAHKIDEGGYQAILANPQVLAHHLAAYRRDELVLAHMEKGAAVLDLTGMVTWANPALRNWVGGNPVGQKLTEALSARIVATDNIDPYEGPRRGIASTFRLQRSENLDRPFLDVTINPVIGKTGDVRQFVAVLRNVTSEVEQQRRLDALHQAGRELAGLDPDQLAEMNLPTRVELLKQNLRRYIRDLLHYDTIEVRLLDRRTGELKPLLQDGMTDEAAHRVLYARTTGNGVTGYVAATGQSYLCGDTAADPLYIQGAAGARSSMTVALKYHDEVVGTLNVESPRTNGFGADDLQFTELFSKEIAAALHTLDLLTAQQSCTASQSLDAVGKEIALPVDDVLGSAAILLERLTGDPDAVGHLRRILAGARAVKDSIRKVGRDLNVVTQGEADLVAPLVGKRVLVVDPDERMRRSAHLLLGRLGAGVETAGTASEGVALLQISPFDAVFLDVKPPDMGGYEAYRRLRAARPEAPVSLTTGFGYDSAHSIVKARAEGMKFVLFKPFRPDQVIQAVLDVTTGDGKSV